MPREARFSSTRGIQDLEHHPRAFVTPAELTKYWQITPSDLNAHIREGRLQAIRFGTGVYRIRTTDAIQFETTHRIKRRTLKQRTGR
jgi:hypothetical protein